MEKKLIAHFDCTNEYGSDCYFEIGETKIVSTEAGEYRETENIHLARFGYRFKLQDKTKPHLLVVRYPDDKDRFMCLSDNSSYDLDTGVTCGGVNAISGKMQEINNYFYPRWEDETVVFTSWGANTPAAVAEFFVYELDDFDEADLPKECFGSENRRYGIQYEDPCGVCNSVGAKSMNEFIDHHIEYMKHCGTNHLTYPINWYHGPIIPVDCQPSSRAISVCMEDRRRYSVARRAKINDWLEYWLERFDEEGFTFKGSMTLLRLGNLMENMNIDEEAIRNGADTYNNMLFNGTVQKAVNDWTAIYNPIIYDKWLEYHVKGKMSNNDHTYSTELIYAYGEKPYEGDELSKKISVPMFNPLHPTVQSQVIELISEIARKYANHKSFNGIAINMWHGTILWYSNLLVGYDDVSIGMFEKETGISIDIASDDPRRFEKRFLLLTTTFRNTFISWRCKKIHEFICRVRDAVKAVREDLTLTLTVWNETSTAYRFLSSAFGSSPEYGASGGFYEAYREGGFDLKLYKDEENIEIAVEKTPTRDYSKNAVNGDNFTNLFVDNTFLGNEVAEILSSASNSTAFIFDSWVEMWGKSSLMECEPDDKNLPKLTNFEFGDIDYIARSNAVYADDTEKKFWFEDQIRITAAYPSGHYLEWLANEVAAHDALEVTEGGLYLDTAHATEQLKFAKQYRKLPKYKFKTLDGDFGIVVVRYLEKDGKTYIYAVNREPYAVGVKINTNSEAYNWTLDPFELKVEIFEGQSVPCEYVVNVPDGIYESYATDVDNALKDIEKTFSEGYFVAGVEELRDRLKEAIQQKNFSFIRHALKCQTMNTVYKVLSGV